MEDKFVIDASVAVKWFIPEEYSDIALKILESFSRRELLLYEPNSMKLEFSNAIRKYYVKGIIKKEIMFEILNEMRRIPISFIAIDWEKVIKAAKIALKENLTVYDAYYLVISDEYKIPVITADDKFIKSAKKHYDIVHLKEFSI